MVGINSCIIWYAFYNSFRIYLYHKNHATWWYLLQGNGFCYFSKERKNLIFSDIKVYAKSCESNRIVCKLSCAFSIFIISYYSWIGKYHKKKFVIFSIDHRLDSQTRFVVMKILPTLTVALQVREFISF